MRYRQIHLDFHTSEWTERVGRGFSADVFAAQLKEAQVDSVTCFARCHHGYLYYESSVNPELIHPGLVRRNLLREQVDALHEAGIRAPIYTTVQWDGRIMREHPEWCGVAPEGGWIGQQPLEPGFYAALCVNTGYRAFLHAHVREIMELFEPDGVFFDIVRPVECVCPTCRTEMDAHGLDPALKPDRVQFAEESITRFRAEFSALIRSYRSDCDIFYNASHIGPGLRPSFDAFSHLEIESLPSGGWGYTHFPAVVRYARTTGKPYLGMTGRFHTYWGDFHSYKNPAALEYECFQMVAHGAGVSIGDQLTPDGVLDAAAYELIGRVYGRIAALEPWLQDTVAVSDTALLTTEEWSREEQAAEIMGAVRMLQELSIQFDVVDSESDLSAYNVLILPDRVPATPDVEVLVETFLKRGCVVLGTFDASLSSMGVRRRSEITVDRDGLIAEGVAYERNDYADYIIPTGPLEAGLVASPYVMYLRGHAIEVSEPGSQSIVPLLYRLPSLSDRSRTRYFSHQQSPAHLEAHREIAAVATPQTVYFSHPLFSTYFEKGPRWVKQMVSNALAYVGGGPLCWHNGPSGLIVTLRRSRSRKTLIVHLLFYIPERRARHMDVIEDVIPIHDIVVWMRPLNGMSVCGARRVPDEASLDIAVEDGVVAIQFGTLEGYGVIECDLE